MRREEGVKRKEERQIRIRKGHKRAKKEIDSGDANEVRTRGEEGGRETG